MPSEAEAPPKVQFSNSMLEFTRRAPPRLALLPPLPVKLTPLMEMSPDAEQLMAPPFQALLPEKVPPEMVILAEL